MALAKRIVAGIALLTALAFVFHRFRGEPKSPPEYT